MPGVPVGSKASPLVGEVGGGRPASAGQKTRALKVQGVRRLKLAPDAITRARQLRREMTPEERKLWRGLREAFPDAHWRKQVPFGINYTADFCSHGHKLVIEVDGGQHAERTAYDEERTRFLNAEGYRVLRFWNNDIRENLDGVLHHIGAHLSSPLVGEDQGGGRPASAGQKTLQVDESLLAPSARADVAPPPNPPHKGEGL